ncbi:flagellar basal body P-ring formation protein FlgA [bacterium]|nr:flagellar basal body P-ring formation protein FlgA [bacterium]
MSVDRSEVLSADSCRSARRRVSELRGKPVEVKDLLGNLTARRALQPGEVLTWSNVEAEKLVRSGETVRMMLESANGGLSISTAGLARSNGAMGDSVAVVNPTSGREVRGVVVGPRLVKVAF